ncbi:hypothetical protein EELLY_v1c01200 [Entomoplasma ellychniae]|uniref:J domain-containing protein n=1 Tax=Entomoplasma ellychniae TaxID=2114 RepID=A0A8E2QXK2_9MOLU|nr:DnaJ domain-containing protein [Entomoplasma ellychniae]PPE04445.1 hypothetical protein EELLY_v1c01200 [Entomoplasma ellychniae]
MLIFLIIIISIMIAIFLVGIVVFLFTNNKNRVTNSQEQLTKNIESVRHQRTIWMRKTKRTVVIGNYEYREEFAQFPYLTDFNKTKKFLIDKKVSFNTIETFIEDMSKIQDQFFSEFRIQQKRLLTNFDKTNIADTSANRAFLMTYYTKSLDNYYLLIKNGFVKLILLRKIAYILGTANFNEKPIVERLLEQLKQNTTELISDLLIRAKEKRKNVSGQTFNKNNFYHQNGWHKQKAHNKQQNNESHWNDFDDEKWAYETLELNSKATFDEVKQQYRKLAKQYHPDINKNEEAKDKMVEINHAYEYIKKIKN